MIASQAWIEELRRRRHDLWQAAEREGCDLLLVYATREHAEAFRYLTNFVPGLGDMWGVMTGPDEMACTLNFHWELLEARTVSGLEDWQGIFDPVPAVMARIKGAAPRRMAVLGLQRLPWPAYRRLMEENPGLEVVDISGHLDQIRRIKSPLEIELLKEAARITDMAFAEIRERVRPGITENEIAAQVAYVFRREGAGLAFDPLVMGGLDPETAVMARSTRPRPLELGRFAAHRHRRRLGGLPGGCYAHDGAGRAQCAAAQGLGHDPGDLRGGGLDGQARRALRPSSPGGGADHQRRGFCAAASHWPRLWPGHLFRVAQPGYGRCPAATGDDHCRRAGYL